MHVYIYDDFVNQKKYDHLLAAIETRITDLGLSGKIIRLGLMKNVHEAIVRELKQGAKTIVAVGNNATVNKVINSRVNIDPGVVPAGKVPLGIIPIGKKSNEIAKSLGIDDEEEACDILSARRIEELDLGLANSLHFLSHAYIQNQGTTLEIDRSYSLEIMEPGTITVVNLPVSGLSLPSGVAPNPKDSSLELFVSSATKKILPLPSRTSSQSMFPFQHLNIINQKQGLLIDNSVTVPTPVEITIAEQKLPLVVGKNREF
jgi:hypothetical protein